MIAAKGGSGKTTTTLLLAVHAASLGMRVAIFDLNAEQPSLTDWLNTRTTQKDLFAPELIEVENLSQDVKVLAHAARHQLLLVDTPPVIDDTGIVEGAVAVSNAVIVPCRPSALDISTMDVMVEICQQHKKPFAFLLCDVTESWKAINNEALAALAELGPVMAARITHKVAYVNAITIGKVGFEIDPKLKTECDVLWIEAARLAKIEAPATSAPAPQKRGAAVAEDEAFSIQKAREIWIAKGGETRGKKARQKKRQKIAGTVDKRSLRATGRSEQFNFRATPELAAKIRDAAASAGMSIVDWMEEAIIAYLPKPGDRDSNA